ncbi:hypothetical protein RVBP17_3000 [Pseudomonas phage sp. 30-3]|uniref:Uncharacterized protein n=1 Tax=Pseudomonas phage vB_PaeM_PA5oct TaxID=2163605 RepID=A0A4Y5JUC5_9CAUD|nr:hypothetical protein PQE65_gp088 [Pseudomonas phage vB_PaeM_PA5oct]QCG76277.1 hypothetical protein EST35_0404 [Pseudomonas phage vB_PaeM_PA5oct]BDR26257.1 hypothetical protein RVBP17_3000 [Pseudomonas phage sp. 30-3]
MNRCKEHLQYRTIKKHTLTCRKCKELSLQIKLFWLQQQAFSIRTDTSGIYIFDNKYNSIYVYSVAWYNTELYGKGTIILE